jgi:hypothetical protein
MQNCYYRSLLFGLVIAGAVGQVPVEITVATDQAVYQLGEPVTIYITAHNPTADTLMLTFPTSCQAEYYLDAFYSGTYHGCYQILTYVTIPPDGDHTWSWTHPADEYPLTPGVHYVVGEVVEHGLSDTLIITVNPTDTLELLSFFPLQIGNRWQYEIWAYIDESPTFEGYRTITVTGDTLLPNGKRYRVVEGLWHFCTEFFRIDTAELKVYQYCPGAGWGDSLCPDSEFVYFDLAPSGDSTTYTTCVGFPVEYQYHYGPHWLVPDSVSSITYDWFSGWAFSYELVQGIGITEWFIGDLGYQAGHLIAAEIDGNQIGEFVYPSDVYFPLAVGNYWSYAGNTDTLTITITDTQTFQGQQYYRFGRYRENSNYLFRKAADQVYVRLDTVESVWYDFAREPGESWEAEDLYGNTFTILLESTTDTVVTPGGTFLGCYRFHHFFGADYEYFEWFAPEVGLVQRDAITIAGTQRWSLIGSNLLAVTAFPNPLLPATITLAQNYPNPFNAVTTIRYELPEFTRVRLVIYDLLGREVAVLVDQKQEPGVKTITWDASQVSSGVYLYRLTTGDRQFTRKLVVLK